MKHLASIIESALDPEANLDTTVRTEAALEPLYKTWVNKNDLKNEWGRTYSSYKVAKPTAIQVTKKMIKALQDAGTYDYKDFKQFLARQKAKDMTNPNGYNIVSSGNGIVLFNGRNERELDEIVVYYVYNGKQHMYLAKFEDSGVDVSVIKSYQNKIVIADSRAQFGFEIPANVAEKIFKASEPSK